MSSVAIGLEGFIKEKYDGLRVNFLDRYDRTCSYVNRFLGRDTSDHDRTTFVWNPKKIPTRTRVVTCLDLPITNPVQLLESYVLAGVQPDHVVFVGDSSILADDTYDMITKKGALVHHVRPDVWNTKSRQQTEEELAAYFDAEVTFGPTHEANNEYAYAPASPKLSPEEFQVFLDTLANRER